MIIATLPLVTGAKCKLKEEKYINAPFFSGVAHFFICSMKLPLESCLYLLHDWNAVVNQGTTAFPS